jgi:DNA-binding NtrC family response regulator
MHNILVVEDEYFQADDCAKAVRRKGCRVVGPFGSMDEVMHADFGRINGAILDINLRGGFVYPLLDLLICLNVPIALWTGYDNLDMPSKYSDVPLFSKSGGCENAIGSLLARMAVVAAAET